MNQNYAIYRNVDLLSPRLRDTTWMIDYRRWKENLQSWINISSSLRNPKFFSLQNLSIKNSSLDKMKHKKSKKKGLGIYTTVKNAPYTTHKWPTHGRVRPENWVVCNSRDDEICWPTHDLTTVTHGRVCWSCVASCAESPTCSDHISFIPPPIDAILEPLESLLSVISIKQISCHLVFCGEIYAPMSEEVSIFTHFSPSSTYLLCFLSDLSP